MSRVGTRHHLAVVDGPDVGWVAPLPEDRAVVVGRSADADLSLDDPDLSRLHAAVRDRRGEVVARRLPGARAAWLRRPRRSRGGRVAMRRPRRLGRRWSSVPVGSRLTAGNSVIEVRGHPGLVEPAPSERVEITQGLGQRLLVPLVMSASMVPLALTSASASPWRTVVWLLLPVALVAAVVWPWLRERASRRRRPDRDADPAPAPPPDPAALLAHADGPPGEVGAGLDLGSTGTGRRRRPQLLPVPEAGRGVAVVGPPEASRAMARWLICQLARRHPPDELGITVPPTWDWAAALPHRSGVASLHVLVIDARDAVEIPGTLPPDTIAVIAAARLSDLAPWCTRVIEVGARHDRCVSTAWAHEVATTIGQASPTTGLPDVVHLSALVGDTTPEAILRRWRRPRAGLTAPLGLGPIGPAILDLAEAGPHALVAGTTGAGKSELLTTWVLGLALAHAPADLHVLLVDYKGGATFGVLAELPHVIDVLTDLDAGATARALASLRAELARRERVLAQMGARSLSELTSRPARPPRLLVVVDEFRTLADSHPDLLDGLVRLAAQGRSLGIHLILATQRPAGAVTADMRANISVRLCLRVLEPTDSIDVLGDATAAALPARPGRAVLRTDASTMIQVAWPGTVQGDVPRLVAAVAAASDLAAAGDPALVTVNPPWAPPLPTRVETSSLTGGGDAALPFLMVDRPEEQRLDAWHLRLVDTLLVTGPPGAGRTTAARTLASEAVRRGVVTHAIADEPVVPEAAPARGTACRPDDVARVQQLLEQLRTHRAGQQLLVVDDVDAVSRALDSVLPYGSGHELLLETVRTARRRGLGVVLTAAPPATRWAAAVRHHLVLAPRDVTDALAAGVPRDLVDIGAPPGRGVLMGPRTARVVQVAVADGSGPWPEPTSPPLRIEPVPALVDLPPETDAVPGGPILLGLGGSDCGPVCASIPDGGTWLVLGGSLSGRSTALQAISARLRASGRAVWSEPGEVAPSSSGVLVIDDADRLSPTAASAAAECAARGVAVVAAARPEALSGTYHELARRLRDPDAVLVLGSAAGTAPWTGLDIRTLLDPVPRPGRGVLVRAGRAVPLQVDRCSGAAQRIVLEEDDGRLVAATEAGSSSPTATTSDAASAG